jgi:NAD(P)-dependent dehydrogenase (short-subunit alcohol dehydrogenase family)
MGRLAGQVAVVFGGNSGIGLASARALAGEGAAVIVAARREPQVHEAVASIRDEGGEARGVAADVTVRAQVDHVISEAIREHGRIDILMNAAGTNIQQRRLDVLTEDDWNSLLTINLTGAFNTLQAVLPQMRSQGGGLIIQVASVSGRWGDLSGAAYQASKHGIVGLCYATMVEERTHGIRATALLPGLCATPLLERRPVPPSPETMRQAMQPEDIAQACVFLAGLPPRTYVPELMLLPGALQFVGNTIV